MGTFLLVLFTFVSAVIFYLVDTYKHRVMIVDSFIQTHWDKKTVIKYKNEIIKDKYPTLYKVVYGFTISEIKFNSKDILSKVQTADKELKRRLKSEINQVIKDRDEDAREVFIWYLFTCKQIELMERSKIEQLHDLREDDTNIDIDSLNKEDVFCLA